MRILTIFCLIALSAHAFAFTPPKGYKLADEFIPDDDFTKSDDITIVRSYRGSPNKYGEPLQFRVFRKENPTQDGYLLLEVDNRATALISYDGAGIAIYHHAFSDLGILYVFKRFPDGTYKRINVDFQKETSLLLTKRLGLQSSTEFEKIYCHPRAWLSNHQLLGHVSGIVDQRTSGAVWFIFDTETKKFTFDLDQIHFYGIY